MRKRRISRVAGVGLSAMMLLSSPLSAQELPGTTSEEALEGRDSVEEQAEGPEQGAVAPSGGNARDAAPSQPGQARVLTLDEAVERATTRGHQIAMAQADVQSAELALEEARFGRLPQVSAEGQYSNYIRTPFIVLPEDSPFGGGVLRTGNKHNFNLSAQVSVPLWSAQLNRSIDLARASAELSRLVVEASQTTVRVEVQRAYLNGLITLESLEVLQQSYATLQKNLELVRALYEQGVAPEYDLIRTEVQVRNVEPELSRAMSNHQGALNYIKLLTAIPIDEDIALSGSLRERFAEAGTAEMAPNFEQNADVIQLSGQRSLVERQVALERAAYWPTLAAFGSFTYQGQGNDLKFWGYEWGETAIAGLSLTVPIYSPGLRQRVAQAEVEQMKLGLQEEFLRQSLRSEFEITRARLADLEKTIEAQERNVAQAERGFSIAQASYEEGAYGLMEVNDAESALTDARLNYTAALNDYLNALLDLEELVGAGSENDD